MLLKLIEMMLVIDVVNRALKLFEIFYPLGNFIEVMIALHIVDRTSQGLQFVNMLDNL